MTATGRAVRATANQLPSQQLYTADEVSAMTKGAVSAYWLEKKARLQEIPARKVGRCWRWADGDIEVLFESCLQLPRQRASAA